MHGSPYGRATSKLVCCRAEDPARPSEPQIIYTALGWKEVGVRAEDVDLLHTEYTAGKAPS